MEQEVNTTDNATLAWAMYVTTLEAVPPGEQPTKHNPKNKAEAMFVLPAVPPIPPLLAFMVGRKKGLKKKNRPTK